jgi:hypothetical protein
LRAPRGLSALITLFEERQARRRLLRAETGEGRAKLAPSSTALALDPAEVVPIGTAGNGVGAESFGGNRKLGDALDLRPGHAVDRLLAAEGGNDVGDQRRDPSAAAGAPVDAFTGAGILGFAPRPAVSPAG